MTESAADENGHTLHDKWAFWFNEKPPKGSTQQDYENCMKKLGSFSTIQEFWRYMNNLDVRTLPSFSTLRLFKAGIKPSWEDPANMDGGKWAFCTNKDRTPELWRTLVLAVIGNSLQCADRLCGIVLAVRPERDAIQIWYGLPEPSADATAEIVSALGLAERDVIYHVHKSSVEHNERLRNSRGSPLPQRRNSTGYGGAQQNGVHLEREEGVEQEQENAAPLRMPHQQQQRQQSQRQHKEHHHHHREREQEQEYNEGVNGGGDDGDTYASKHKNSNEPHGGGEVTAIARENDKNAPTKNTTNDNINSANRPQTSEHGDDKNAVVSGHAIANGRVPPPSEQQNNGVRDHSIGNDGDQGEEKKCIAEQQQQQNGKNDEGDEDDLVDAIWGAKAPPIGDWGELADEEDNETKEDAVEEEQQRYANQSGQCRQKVCSDSNERNKHAHTNGGGASTDRAGGGNAKDGTKSSSPLGASSTLALSWGDQVELEEEEKKKKREKRSQKRANRNSMGARDETSIRHKSDDDSGDSNHPRHAGSSNHASGGPSQESQLSWGDLAELADEEDDRSTNGSDDDDAGFYCNHDEENATGEGGRHNAWDGGTTAHKQAFRSADRTRQQSDVGLPRTHSTGSVRRGSTEGYNRTGWDHHANSDIAKGSHKKSHSFSSPQDHPRHRRNNSGGGSGYHTQPHNHGIRHSQSASSPHHSPRVAAGGSSGSNNNNSWRATRPSPRGKVQTDAHLFSKTKVARTDSGSYSYVAADSSQGPNDFDSPKHRGNRERPTDDQKRHASLNGKGDSQRSKQQSPHRRDSVHASGNSNNKTKNPSTHPMGNGNHSPAGSAKSANPPGFPLYPRKQSMSSSSPSSPASVAAGSDDERKAAFVPKKILQRKLSNSDRSLALQGGGALSPASARKQQSSPSSSPPPTFAAVVAGHAHQPPAHASATSTLPCATSAPQPSAPSASPAGATPKETVAPCSATTDDSAAVTAAPVSSPEERSASGAASPSNTVESDGVAMPDGACDTALAQTEANAASTCDDNHDTENAAAEQHRTDAARDRTDNTSPRPSKSPRHSSRKHEKRKARRAVRAQKRKELPNLRLHWLVFFSIVLLTCSIFLGAFFAPYLKANVQM